MNWPRFIRLSLAWVINEAGTCGWAADRQQAANQPTDHGSWQRRWGCCIRSQSKMSFSWCYCWTQASTYTSSRCKYTHGHPGILPFAAFLLNERRSNESAESILLCYFLERLLLVANVSFQHEYILPFPDSWWSFLSTPNVASFYSSFNFLQSLLLT